MLVLLILIICAFPVLAQDSGSNWQEETVIKIHDRDADFRSVIQEADIPKGATQQDKDKLVQARVQAWLKFVEEQSSKPPYVPTKEESIESVTRQADELESATTQLMSNKPLLKEVQAIIAKLQAVVDSLNTASVGGKIEP